MLELDEFELYRRLIIIAAEDVEISKETAVVCWLMMAVSKGFVTSNFHKRFVLDYVSSLVLHPRCKRLDICCSNNSNANNYQQLSLDEVLDSNHKDKKYISAIYLRNFYGGLAGDGPMLVRICSYYIIEDDNIKNIQTEQVSANLQMKFSFSDAAVDFHIYPELVSLIHKDIENSGIDKEIIKRCIWECSSRINYRKEEMTQLYPIWEKIRLSFLYHTKVYISKIF